MNKNWVVSQFSARKISIKKRIFQLLGNEFDPYPKLPSDLGLSPSTQHQMGGVGAELALDWHRAKVADTHEWQRKARAKLVELTGYGRFGGGPGVNYERNLTNRDGLKHRSLYLKVRNGLDLPIRMIWDDEIQTGEPVPVFICLQGTNSGMHLSWGEYRMPADPIKIYNGADFARQIARLGYLAICLEQSCFGERQEKLLSPKSPTPCIDAANHALLFGRSLLGERVSDVSSVVNWLLEGSVGLSIDTKRIYVMGSSAGGTTALFSGALDTRISGILAAGCIGFFRDTALVRRDNEGQNVVPGILRWFELDSVVSLCAPRPFVTVSGNEDHIWPYKGAESVVESARLVYKNLKASKVLIAAEGKGGDRFYPKIAWSAFATALKNADHRIPLKMKALVK